MPVPKFHEFLLPALRLAADGQPRVVRDSCAPLADALGVSPEDRAHLIPSGKQTTVYNRVQWAVTYLVKAGLLERPSRGVFRITEAGRGVLANPPAKMNKSWLKRFDKFKEFVDGDGKPEDNGGGDDPPGDGTPEEQIAAGVKQINDALADELIDSIKQSPPAFFEQLVIDVLVAMGYGGSQDDAAQAVGKSGDGGIDGTIKEDRLGLDVIYVQAKRWDNTVGRPVVQGFAGSLDLFKARKGVFITTSDFAQPARDFARDIEKKIILIDGKMLARLMIEHNVGVTTTATYHLKKLDADYFDPSL